MKRPFIFSAFLILSVSVTTAQQSRFPIKSGSVWRINYEYFSSCWDGEFVHLNGDEEYKYFVDGDTVVGTRSYFKLYKTGIIYLDTPFGVTHKYMGAIRDSADRFYFMAEEQQVEKLLYDFTLEEGDSIGMEGTGMKFPISSITTLESGRKQYQLDIMTVHCGSANTIIEGTGWLGGLLEGNSCSGHPGVRGSYLVCYSENDQVIYQNTQTRCGSQLQCEDIVVSADDIITPVVPVVMVLQDGRLSISLSLDLPGIYDLQIFSATGTQIYSIRSELPIAFNTGKLSNGIYLLRLSHKKRFYTAKVLIE